VKRPLNGYPWFPPFDPHIAYPEYPFTSISDLPNDVYDMVRQTLWDLGLDASNHGTPQWNPLGEYIESGQTVVIKPNFVLDYNQEHPGKEALAAVVTDGSVLRPIVDYAFKACGPTGEIVICETPLQNEVTIQLFNNVAEFTGTQRMVAEVRKRGVPLELIDLRSQVRRTNRFGFWHILKMKGDPLGYALFDLGSKSLFAGVAPDRLQTNDWEDVSKYHSRGCHLYSVSKTILSAKTVVNVPKLKVHKKTGLTAAVKNMFAISNRKDWIPHWQEGVDDKPLSTSRMHALLKYCYSKPALHPIAHFVHQRVLRGPLEGYGNWWGNDTTWRGVLDLNRILLYGDVNGNLSDERQRRMLVIVDGIIAGEGLGPLGPTPRPFGAIIGGDDSVAVDIACAQLMRLDPKKVKLLVNALNAPEPRLTSCTMEDLEPDPNFLPLSEKFVLHPDWESARLFDHDSANPDEPAASFQRKEVVTLKKQNYSPRPF
jgi:uncharacterized protein (DUF362 family)